jgi:predicted ArsR family transcriptional regulator
LVRQLKKVLPAEQVEAAFKALAQDFAGSVQPNLAELPVKERLERVTSFLNERGYLARWEVDESAAGGGFLLHKSNCPYAGVSDEHNELCLMDQALINELMGESCQRIESMAKEGRCCTYRVAGPVDLEFPLHEFKGGGMPLPNISLIGIDGVTA